MSQTKLTNNTLAFITPSSSGTATDTEVFSFEISEDTTSGGGKLELNYTGVATSFSQMQLFSLDGTTTLVTTDDLASYAKTDALDIYATTADLDAAADDLASAIPAGYSDANVETFLNGGETGSVPPTISPGLIVSGNQAMGGGLDDLGLVVEHNAQVGGKLQVVGVGRSTDPFDAALIVDSGNLTVSDGNLTVTSGNLTVTGATDFDGNLTVTGDITCDSDERLKTNIALISNGSQIVEQLRGVKFEWKDSSKKSGPQIGVIAQEVESVLPELVSTGKDGFKSVDYMKMNAVLIEAFKELSAEVKSLKEQLAALSS